MCGATGTCSVRMISLLLRKLPLLPTNSKDLTSLESDVQVLDPVPPSSLPPHFLLTTEVVPSSLPAEDRVLRDICFTVR